MSISMHTLPLPALEDRLALGAVSSVGIRAEAEGDGQGAVDAILKGVPFLDRHYALKPVVVLHEALPSRRVAVRPRHRATGVWHGKALKLFFGRLGLLASQCAKLLLARTAQRA